MKKQRGITLIALVITIIVLLILAGVTIVTLTGDNGLLQKSTNSKEKNEEAGVCENIKLAYGEYQIAQHTGTDKTAEKIIEDSLKSIYGDNVTKVKIKNEKITINMKVNNIPKTYIYKTTTGEAYEYVDVFDYKGKEKKDLIPGDDISIETENFRVFYNQDGIIKAMPWYNITLPSNMEEELPIQSSKAGTIEFSTESYWYVTTSYGSITDTESIEKINEIDMYNPANKIQKYIEAYAKTLEGLKAENIEVRIGRYNELNLEEISNDMRKPSGRCILDWIREYL